MFARLRIKNHELRIKNLILNILFMTLASLFMIHPVYAQTSISTPSANPYTSPSGEAGLTPIPSYISPTSPLYTDMLLNNLFHTFSCIAVGQSVIGQPCLTYQITKNAQGAVQGIPIISQINTSGGILGTTTSFIEALYTNPAVKTADYLASIGEELGIIKNVNAQVTGSGATILEPIKSLWQVSRNISYVIMIIIFIVIGLMIIFRNKINPQTVITAQAALPGLVIGLILITFSYLLAGLISDTAFIGTNIVGAYFSAVKDPKASPQNLVKDLTRFSVLDIFSPFIGIVSNDKAQEAIDSILGKMGEETELKLKLLAGFLGSQFIAPLAGGIASPALGPWALIAGPAITAVTGLLTGAAPGFFLGYTISFIASLALIYQMLQLLLKLIKTYLTIIFLLISSPFQFLFASLPGRQGLATDWIRNMLGNVLVFPAVIAVFYFVAFIFPNNIPIDFPLKVSELNQSQKNVTFPSTAYAASIDVPGRTNFPLLGGMNLGFVKILLAFGALMALPAIPDLVVKAIGKVGQAGQVIGQEISGGMRSGQGYSSQLQSGASGTASNLKKGIFGETQYRWEGERLVKTYGAPGAWNANKIGLQGAANAGTGRSTVKP